MPVDPETGKEYPYTKQGIAQHKEDTIAKFKQSPFPMVEGTSEHKSALKYQQYMDMAKMGVDMMNASKQGGGEGEKKKKTYKSDLSIDKI